ncbi:hypothetical protein [Clostridium botulinum]|uniref:hypothetical protein n=1 Tax=Clostridium botulinum TaxID=1491 RepID=UPI0019672E0B|nr:hypothetical protein [Clostridium botulinum]MBN1060199.1 hypothetical protein [Clostridium botulinum]
MGKGNEELNVFIKFTEENKGELNSTIKNHLAKCERDGVVAWGQFSSDPKKGKVSKKQELIKQIKNGKKTYVFFYNSSANELYSAELKDIVNKHDLDESKIYELKNMVPDYYKHLVGKNIIDSKTEKFIYAYFIIENLKNIDIKHASNIYKTTNNEPILEDKSQKSLFYVHIDEN